jgi:hypothetical protein
MINAKVGLPIMADTNDCRVSQRQAPERAAV